MVEVKNLSKSYKKNKNEIEVLKNINFTVADGAIVAILGHNGSGKSTLIKCMTGVIKPTIGNVYIDGINVFKKQKKLISSMGVVFNQKPSFIVDLKVEDNLFFFKTVYGLSTEKYDKMINLINSFLDIEPLYKKQYRKLSFGERVKCEIASVLLHTPKYIFLDEPTIGLDYKAKKGLYNLIKFYNKTYGSTIFIITHEVDYIQSIVDRALIINKGSICYDKNSEDLIELGKEINYDMELSFSTIKSENLFNELISEAEIVDKDKKIIRFKFSTHEEKNMLLERSMKAIEISEMKIEKIQLRGIWENVFKIN